MRRFAVAMAVLVLVLGACGGGDDGSASSSDSTGNGASTPSETSAGDGASGDVTDPQPPGQAYASVDGLEFTFTERGGVACSISEDAITFSFIIGDNEVVIGGGANHEDGEWFGSMRLDVANPDTEPGPISYFPDLMGVTSGIAVDGQSMSYVGPMQKQPANDGSNPPPVDVGDGTFSATCP